MSYQEPQPDRPRRRGPQPPQQRGSGVGRIVGFSCLGVVGLVLVFAVGSAAVLGGEGDSARPGAEPAATASAATPDKAGATETAGRGTHKPAGQPVKIVATRTDFQGSALADGTDYTSVRITISNDGEAGIGVDPLYFSLTGTDGSRHPAELAVDENQIATVELAPGESVTGTVTGKGTFTPAYVTFVDGLLGATVRGDVVG
ncbi:DUF4352 domain-containing protein [Streptomyces sp. NPDC057428]|uniref:DUF4352 domain-containing protein n=1 Tax=Streptomyces sp. NPDC057428 TaxID=3346129 RepID=UPI00369A5662